MTLSKSFVSRQVDRYRPAYARHPENKPRTCVFAGTTNKNDYLKDETGNRRFWPIPCIAIQIEKFSQDRDLLLAETVHRFKKNELFLMSEEGLTHAAVIQDSRYQGDSWEEPIANYIEDKTRVTMDEIYEFVLFPDNDMSRRNRSGDTRIGKILRRFGMEKKQLRVNGSRKSVYIKMN